MDLTKWGDHIFTNNYKNAIIYKRRSKAIFYFYINLYDKYYDVELKYKDKVILKFKDSLIDSNNLNSFIREIGYQKYYFEDVKIILKKIERKTSFLRKINKSSFRTTKFITMHLETRTLNDGIMIPYCVSIFDGEICESFYISDYENSEKLLETSIVYFMKRKYHQYKVFLHNFSNFDGIFLLRIISSLSKNIRPIRDGNIIILNFTFGSNNYKLFFRDSFLLLLTSLRKLASYFKVENKSILSHLSMNDSSIELEYKDSVPSFYKFINISLEVFNNYCNLFEVW